MSIQTTTFDATFPGELITPDHHDFDTAREPPEAKWFYMCEAMWMDPAHAESEAAWARSLVQTLRPWSTGKSLPNFLSADDGHARLRASYSEDKFDRLVALKVEYDPGNVFVLNQNIPPSVLADRSRQRPIRVVRSQAGTTMGGI